MTDPLGFKIIVGHRSQLVNKVLLIGVDSSGWYPRRVAHAFEVPMRKHTREADVSSHSFSTATNSSDQFFRHSLFAIEIRGVTPLATPLSRVISKIQR